MKRYIKSSKIPAYEKGDWQIYQGDDGVTIYRNCMHYLDGLPGKEWTTVYSIWPDRLISYAPFGSRGTIIKHYSPELSPEEMMNEAIDIVNEHKR